MRIPLVGIGVPTGILSLIVIFAIGATAFRISESSLTCASCHQGTVEFHNWQASVHSGVTCEDCHVTSEPVQVEFAAMTEADRAHKRLARVLGSDRIQLQVSDDRCISCHAEAREIESADLKISHSTHWDQGSGCISCHGGVTHGEPGEYKRIPAMRTCVQCHETQNASKTCNTCHHTLDYLQATSAATEWVRNHPKVDSDEPSFCYSCHKGGYRLELMAAHRRHPAGWTETHVTDAKQRPGECLDCHTEQFCISCHQNEIPRSHAAATWLASHGEESKPADCRICHQQQFCMSCHIHSKPVSHDTRWMRAHGTASIRDSSSCYSCHTKKNCLDCHGLPMPHPGNWQTAHTSTARANDRLCAKCHTPRSCTDCHSQSRPRSHSTNWLQQHMTPQDGCDTCHLPFDSKEANGRIKSESKVCLACHGRGTAAAVPADHAEPGFAKGHGKPIKTDISPCMTCHSNETFCTPCHGTQMPHQRGWILGHRSYEQSSLDKDGSCMKCHTPASCRCHGIQ